MTLDLKRITNLAEWVLVALDQRRVTMHLGTAVLGLSKKSLVLADELLSNKPKQKLCLS